MKMLTCTRIIRGWIRKDNRAHIINVEKKMTNLSLFPDDMMAYLINPRDSIKSYEN